MVAASTPRSLLVTSPPAEEEARSPARNDDDGRAPPKRQARALRARVGVRPARPKRIETLVVHHWSGLTILPCVRRTLSISGSRRRPGRSLRPPVPREPQRPGRPLERFVRCCSHLKKPESFAAIDQTGTIVYPRWRLGSARHLRPRDNLGPGTILHRGTELARAPFLGYGHPVKVSWSRRKPPGQRVFGAASGFLKPPVCLSCI